ncbi:MAG: serine/threonine-protein kinase [Methylococcaceae bacterium]
MSDHQHCINCLEEAEGSYSYPCVQCGWSPDQYSETGLYLSPGTILNNQYQIGKMLGHGGFGITYLAWDNLLHRRLAIKEYMPRDFATRNATNSTISIYAGAATESFAYGLERFLDEARTLAKFQQHAGIVSVLNVFYGNSTGYMVMEYVEGRTLKDYLLEKGLLSWELTLQLFMPIMDALREVHKGGIMHRDISPDNIYLCNDNRIKLLDFGSARYALGGHSLSLSVVVKPGYAPEEQYRAKGKQGPWTDVYSVAASMYRCIAGVVPPDALDRLDEDELISPSKLGIPMPEKSEAALMMALAIKANVRTQSVEALQQAIWAQTTNNEPGATKPQAKQIVTPAMVIQEEPITVDLTVNVVSDGVTLTASVMTYDQENTLVDRIPKCPPAMATQEEPITIDLTDNTLSDGVSLTASVVSYAQHTKSIDRVKGKQGTWSDVYTVDEKKGKHTQIKRLGVAIPVLFIIFIISYNISSYISSHHNLPSKIDHAVVLYNANDYKNAIKEFYAIIAVNSDSSEFEIKGALNYLGFIYYQGLGVTQDYQIAFAFFSRAADLGEPFSQNALGNMYFGGYGVTKNKKLAFTWYQKAAAQGEVNSISALKKWDVK